MEQPNASIAAIDYHSGRKLNRDRINRMAICEYIRQNRNIFITGAAGNGKTYMACAFGMKACNQYYSTKFIRLPEMLMDLQVAKDAGDLQDALKKYSKPVLLIIDEWLLLKLTEQEVRSLLEAIHKRRKKSSTIFRSQWAENDWYDQICGGESALAGAIMDCISYDSYKIKIEYINKNNDRSMREVHGMPKDEAQ